MVRFCTRVLLLVSFAHHHVIIFNQFFSFGLDTNPFCINCNWFLQDEYKRRVEELEKSQALRTKAMREMEKRPARKHRFGILRIRIPGPDGGYILQGPFGAYEKISAVVDFVRENLINEQLPFALATALGNKLSNLDARLNELDLVPAAIMNFQSLLPAPPSGRTSDLQLLKDETLSMIRPLS